MKTLFISILLLSAAVSAQSPPGAESMALAPARFELEMKPGTETTVVVDVDYRYAVDSTKPARIVASLGDWNITRDGKVEFYPANSTANSASSWIMYSPGEASVMPGSVHQIRVTVSVPPDAAPGDHLAALIIEQRPDTLKFEQSARRMIVRYRMASVFYIKVPGLTRQGDLENLLAEFTPDSIRVTPVMKNRGNSVIRPTASITMLDADGKTVTEIPEAEMLPILGGSETALPVRIEKALASGRYTVKYRVDFQDGRPATEGVTDLVVTAPQIAAVSSAPKKP